MQIDPINEVTRRSVVNSMAELKAQSKAVSAKLTDQANVLKGLAKSLKQQDELRVRAQRTAVQTENANFLKNLGKGTKALDEERARTQAFFDEFIKRSLRRS